MHHSFVASWALAKGLFTYLTIYIFTHQRLTSDYRAKTFLEHYITHSAEMGGNLSNTGINPSASARDSSHGSTWRYIRHTQRLHP